MSLAVSDEKHVHVAPVMVDDV